MITATVLSGAAVVSVVTAGVVTAFTMFRGTPKPTPILTLTDDSAPVSAIAEETKADASPQHKRLLELTASLRDEISDTFYIEKENQLDAATKQRSTKYSNQLVLEKVKMDLKNEGKDILLEIVEAEEKKLTSETKEVDPDVVFERVKVKSLAELKAAQTELKQQATEVETLYARYHTANAEQKKLMAQLSSAVNGVARKYESYCEAELAKATTNKETKKAALLAVGKQMFRHFATVTDHPELGISVKSIPLIQQQQFRKEDMSRRDQAIEESEAAKQINNVSVPLALQAWLDNIRVVRGKAGEVKSEEKDIAVVAEKQMVSLFQPGSDLHEAKVVEIGVSGICTATPKAAELVSQVENLGDELYKKADFSEERANDRPLAPGRLSPITIAQNKAKAALNSVDALTRIVNDAHADFDQRSEAEYKQLAKDVNAVTEKRTQECKDFEQSLLQLSSPRVSIEQRASAIDVYSQHAASFSEAVAGTELDQQETKITNRKADLLRKFGAVDETQIAARKQGVAEVQTKVRDVAERHRKFKEKHPDIVEESQQVDVLREMLLYLKYEAYGDKTTLKIWSPNTVSFGGFFAKSEEIAGSKVSIGHGVYEVRQAFQDKNIKTMLYPEMVKLYEKVTQAIKNRPEKKKGRSDVMQAGHDAIKALPEAGRLARTHLGEIKMAFQGLGAEADLVSPGVRRGSR